ncbi:MAG: hypothetical protein H8D45_17325 [Bacteroidetes bacterium]|nr:hypothetical protein [Bacteroidota bacterium]MBL7103690.1 hypothetical protein [Bacteroidales bacterium]
MKRLNKLAKWIANTNWGKIISTIVLAVIIEIIKQVNEAIKQINIDMGNWTPFLQIMVPLVGFLLILYFIQWIRKKYQQKADKSEIPDISNKADKSEINNISNKADKSEINNLIEKLNGLIERSSYNFDKIQQMKSDFANKGIEGVVKSIANNDYVLKTDFETYEPDNPQ